jgi:hypothetical protein
VGTTLYRIKRLPEDSSANVHVIFKENNALQSLRP